MIARYREPAGPGVRVNSGVVEGAEVMGLYNPLIAKLIVWDRDRESARRRMLPRALSEYAIEGISTLIGFHRALLSHPCFVEGATCRGLVESAARRARPGADDPGGPATVGTGRTRDRVVLAEVDGRRFEVRLHAAEPPYAELARRRRERVSGGTTGAGSEAVVSPMQGTVLAVEVSDGDEVSPGQVICVIEAMKMENEVTAHRPGLVSDLAVRAGDAVKTGQVVCTVSSDGDA